MFAFFARRLSKNAMASHVIYNSRSVFARDIVIRWPLHTRDFVDAEVALIVHVMNVTVAEKQN